nr:MAG TPA: hypothetical protein [Caudoviricetes sp.]
MACLLIDFIALSKSLKSIPKVRVAFFAIFSLFLS